MSMPYTIDRDIDGHPIIFEGRSLSKKEILNILNNQQKSIAELEKQVEWISVDKYINRYLQGECWIYYQERVVKSFQDEGNFLSIAPESLYLYKTEHISAVMRIDKPAPPKE